jgi:predicted ArsR family transcriptional regulator
MTIDRDEWLAAVYEVCGLPRHDDGSITIREFAEMIGVKHTTAKVRMRRLVGEGRAVQTMRRITDVLGRSQYVPAYRLVQS